MKRALYISVGTIFGVVAGYITWLVAEPFFTGTMKSDSDINDLVKIYLFSQLILAIFGGWLGNRLYKKI